MPYTAGLGGILVCLSPANRQCGYDNAAELWCVPKMWVAFAWRLSGVLGGRSGVIGNITPLVKALCRKG